MSTEEEAALGSDELGWAPPSLRSHPTGFEAVSKILKEAGKRDPYLIYSKLRSCTSACGARNSELGTVEQSWVVVTTEYWFGEVPRTHGGVSLLGTTSFLFSG